MGQARRFAAGGMDDILRGNTGTADQGPSDVYPEDPITIHTGEVPVGATAPPRYPWTHLVEETLAAGQVTVVDPGSGHHREMYAPCPADGHAAAVWRVVRGGGHAVTELTMRCPSCGGEFVATLDAIFLQ